MDNDPKLNCKEVLVHVHEGTWCANISWRREKSLGKILLLHDFRLYEDRESVKKMVTLREVMIAGP